MRKAWPTRKWTVIWDGVNQGEFYGTRPEKAAKAWAFHRCIDLPVGMTTIVKISMARGSDSRIWEVEMTRIKAWSARAKNEP